MKTTTSRTTLLKSLLLLAPIAALAIGVPACSDPPPPSLAIVSIYNTSNDAATSITYVRYENGTVAGDASKGIAIGEGLSVVLTLGRTIADPPSKKAEADALKTKAFRLNVTGDSITATPVTNTIERIIVSGMKIGTSQLIFSVDGAQGSVTMPVTVVDQNAVPPDVQPPDLPKETPKEAGASEGDSDAGASDGG